MMSKLTHVGSMDILRLIHGFSKITNSVDIRSCDKMIALGRLVYYCLVGIMMNFFLLDPMFLKYM